MMHFRLQRQSGSSAPQTAPSNTEPTPTSAGAESKGRTPDARFDEMPSRPPGYPNVKARPLHRLRLAPASLLMRLKRALRPSPPQTSYHKYLNHDVHREIAALLPPEDCKNFCVLNRELHDPDFAAKANCALRAKRLLTRKQRERAGTTAYENARQRELTEALQLVPYMRPVDRPGILVAATTYLEQGWVDDETARSNLDRQLYTMVTAKDTPLTQETVYAASMLELSDLTDQRDEIFASILHLYDRMLKKGELEGNFIVNALSQLPSLSTEAQRNAIDCLDAMWRQWKDTAQSRLASLPSAELSEATDMLRKIKQDWTTMREAVDQR